MLRRKRSLTDGSSSFPPSRGQPGPVLRSQGTYFLTTDIAKLRFNGNDVDFCKHMTEHARVAAIPLSVFYTGEEPRTLVRFAFCKRREVLDEALRRLANHFPHN